MIRLNLGGASHSGAIFKMGSKGHQSMSSARLSNLNANANPVTNPFILKPWDKKNIVDKKDGTEEGEIIDHGSADGNGEDGEDDGEDDVGDGEGVGNGHDGQQFEGNVIGNDSSADGFAINKK